MDEEYNESFLQEDIQSMQSLTDEIPPSHMAISPEIANNSKTLSRRRNMNIVSEQSPRRKYLVVKNKSAKRGLVLRPET